MHFQIDKEISYFLPEDGNTVNELNEQYDNNFDVDNLFEYEKCW